MTIRLTEAAAQEILDALDESLDNYELDLMNDDEGEFAEPAKQVLDARNVMAQVMGKPEREMEIEEYFASLGKED